MLQIVEVVDTKKAFKTGQKDEDGNVLFDGSIQVRIAGNYAVVGNVRTVWAAPLSFNKRIPLIGEHVALLEAPFVETTAIQTKARQFYYFTIVNSVNDVTLQHFPKLWDRKGLANGSKNASEILADREQVGYTFSKNPGRSKMLQPFEGDDIWEGRFGQSIRFSRHYSTVNAPGVSIYEKQSSGYWPGKKSNDPIMIIKVKKPTKGNDYDIEDLGEDESSIYLTTSQKLLKLSPGFTKNCEAKFSPSWGKGSQIAISSDRVVLNAKNDSALLIGNKKSVVTAKKVILESDKYRVDLDALMTWIKNLGEQLFKLASGEAQFSTAMGPTGPATNVASIAKIVKADFPRYFKNPGCTGDPDLGLPGLPSLPNLDLGLPSADGGGGGGGGGGAGGGGGGAGGGGGDGGSGASAPASGNLVTTDQAGLPTRNNQNFRSPISADLAESVLPVLLSNDLVVTDTNDTAIHKSKAQQAGLSIDVNFKNYTATPDSIMKAIDDGKANNLNLVYEVKTKEERAALISKKPELAKHVKVVDYISAPHFSVYMG